MHEYVEMIYKYICISIANLEYIPSDKQMYP